MKFLYFKANEPTHRWERRNPDLSGPDVYDVKSVDSGRAMFKVLCNKRDHSREGYAILITNDEVIKLQYKLGRIVTA